MEAAQESQIEHTNEVTEPCPKLNLRLNKGVAVILEGGKQDLLHLVRELTEALHGRRGDR